jgi:outer membrane protein
MPACLRIGALLSALFLNCALADAPSDLWSLYAEASREDPSLQREQAYHQASQQREKEARGRLLPQLSLSNTYSRSRQDYEQGRLLYNGSSHGVNLRQPLYDPAVWRNYERFRELTEQQHLAIDDTQKQTALQIAELYFTILAAEDERDLTQAELQATQRNQQRIQALFKRQMAMLTDLLDADARAAQLQANLLDAENAVQSSRDAMAERIGRPVEEPLKRLGAQPDFNRLRRHEVDWVAKALQLNPALRSQEHGIAAAEHAVREAKAGHLPQVSLNLTAQRSDLGYEGNPSPESTNLIAAVGIELPLYTGGSTRARSAALQAEQQAARHDYERLRREIIRQTRDAQLKVETAPARIHAAAQALQAAIKSRQAAERAFELGIFNAVDLLERVRDEYRSRRDLLRSQYSYITQLLLLYRWSGTLGNEDIINVSALLTNMHEHWRS